MWCNNMFPSLPFLFQVAYSAYSTAKLASYIGKRHDHHLNKLMTTFKKQQQEMADLLKKEKRLRDESHIQKEELASNTQAENNVERVWKWLRKQYLTNSKIMYVYCGSY